MADDEILHQDDVEGVIDASIEAGVGEDNPAIDDLEDAGVAYVQADSQAVVDAVNGILAALRNNGIIAESEV